jgi:uncharacterized protein (DUF58 family)
MKKTPSKYSFALNGVYPQLAQLLALQKYTLMLSLENVSRTSPSAGNWQSRIRGRGLDFAEVRRYQAGDDIRSIDWRVTAKTQKTHTRLFTQERERPIILAADLRSDMFFGSVNCFKSVTCAAVISALAWVALKSKDRVGGLVIGDAEHIELRPKANRKVVLNFIRYLSDFCFKLDSPNATAAKQDMGQLLRKLKQVAKPGSEVYIASDFHDIGDANLSQLTHLSRHCKITFLHITDPLEWQLPLNKQLLVTDGKLTSKLSASKHNTDLMQRRVESLQSICRPLKIEIIHISTSDDLLSVLESRFSNLAHSKRRRV